MPVAGDASEEITRSRSEWLARLQAGDLDGYLSVMATDVVWLPPRGAAIEGIGALRTWLGPSLARYRYALSVFDVQLRLAGEWAFEQGRFFSVLTPLGEPQDNRVPLVHDGQCALFWRRSPAGRWQIKRYADSS